MVPFELMEGHGLAAGLGRGKCLNGLNKKCLNTKVFKQMSPVAPTCLNGLNQKCLNTKVFKHMPLVALTCLNGLNPFGETCGWHMFKHLLTP